MPEFDSREFRAALGSFGTGVTIVTARDGEGAPVGMTASSFNSVSMDPPLVLWSVTKTAHSAPAFHAAQRFAIHVLASNQTDLSNGFSRAGEDKFSQCDWHADEQDVPCIDGVACRFDCRQWAVYEGGDHWIIVGEVLNFERAQKSGLLFAGGAYAKSVAMVSDPSEESANSELIDSTLMYHLSHAYQSMLGDFHVEIQACGLSLRQWRVLASLSGEGAQRDLDTLSRLTFIGPVPLTDLLDQMAENDLCTLQGSTVSITKKGKDAVAGLLAKAVELEGAALKNLSKSELLDQLKTLIDNLGGPYWPD